MNILIKNNLVRQMKALEVLRDLLQEEFALLTERKPQDISSIEFSIHELMRQIAMERQDIKQLLGGGKIKDYMELLTASQDPGPKLAELLGRTFQRIDDLEQDCARKASRNTELALALLDQNQALLDFMHKSLQPKQQHTYNPYGKMKNNGASGSLIKGRL